MHALSTFWHAFQYFRILQYIALFPKRDYIVFTISLNISVYVVNKIQ